MFSVPFIILPYLLGILVAVKSHGYDPGLFLAAMGFVPLVTIHFAANLQSDIFDYKKGIDVVPNSLSGGVVRKWISIKEAWIAVLSLYSVAIASGLYLTFELGAVYIPFLVTGLLLSIFYSAGNRLAFKYNFTGEWFIFAGFGILIPVYGYLMIAGSLSLDPVILSLPAAFLMAAVKHANNWIAVLTPGNKERGTTANLMGSTNSRLYFCAMVLIPYLIIAGALLGVDIPSFRAPSSTALIFVSVPLAALLVFRTYRTSRVNTNIRVLGLDSLTAALYVFFMLLVCASVILG